MKKDLKVLAVLIVLPLFFYFQNVKAQTAIEKQDGLIPGSADSIKPVGVGEVVPVVNFTTVEGQSIALTSIVKENPVVLIFYRGSWCPYCNKHLKELTDIDPKLKKQGFKILVVSPDKPEKLKESLDKHEMSYELMSDFSMEASKAFGIAFRVDEKTIKKYKFIGIDLEEASGEDHNLLPVPSVFLIDKEGVIRYRYYDSNYKKRLSGEEILKVAKKFRQKD